MGILKIQKNKGFTLIETLVAVSIFSFAVVALLIILGKSVGDTNYAKKKMIADYLAQEGVEYVRNIRDSYVLFSASGQVGWDAFNSRMIAASCASANGCYFDDQSLNYSDTTYPILDISIASCGSSCPSLLYNTSTGKYGYASGSSSGFTRKIQISTISNEVKVLSTVFWNHAGSTYSLTLSSTLFNWVQ